VRIGGEHRAPEVPALEASSKRVLDTLEDVPTAARATEFQECFVNVSTSLEASACQRRLKTDLLSGVSPK